MLRAWVPELSFHDDFKPILSLDCHPSGRFITAGVDHHLRVWSIDDAQRDKEGCPRIRFLSQAPDAGDPKPINVVRFSPDGSLIAAGSDNATITLYRRVEGEEEEKEGKEGDGKEEATVSPMQVQATDEPPPVDATAASASPCTPLATDEGEVKGVKVEVKEASTVIDLDNSSSSFPPSTPPASGLPSSPPPPSSPSSPISSPFGSDPSLTPICVESYRRVLTLRGHLQEVYALSWSPCGGWLMSGSIDGRVYVWDVKEGKAVGGWDDHHGYVQGVGWDPLGLFLVTVSSDRTVKLYRRSKPRSKHSPYWRLAHSLKHRRLPLAPPAEADVTLVDPSPSPPAPSTPSSASSSPAPSAPSSAVSASPAVVPMFVDETLPSFFRRPAWSPCGRFLLLPAGMMGEGKGAWCSWLYNRDDLTTPVACLPHPEPSVAAAFSPYPYLPPSPSTPTPSTLPLSLLFCVATTKSLFFYTTHSFHPVACVTNLHLSSLTDVAWCRGGVGGDEAVDRVLVSSSDGYVSLIEVEGVVTKVTGEGEVQWRAEVELRREAARQAWERGVEEEEWGVRRKKKGKVGATVAGGESAKSTPPEVGGDGKEEGKEEGGQGGKAKVKAEFVLTEEMAAQITALVEKGQKATSEAIRVHCEVSKGRAQKMARKWKERQRAAAAAKAAEGMSGKEEKVGGGSAQAGGEAVVDAKAEKRERREKRRVQEEAVKRSMKTLDTFFSKAAAPMSIELSPPLPTPPSPSPAPLTSSSPPSTSSPSSAVAGAAAELPLLPFIPMPSAPLVEGRGVKRKITPTLVADLNHTSPPQPQPPAPKTEAAKGGKEEQTQAQSQPVKVQAKEKAKETKRAKKKAKGKAKAKAKKSAAATTTRGLSKAAPTAPSPTPTSGAKASAVAGSVSIDLTDELAPPVQSTPEPPATMIRRTSGGHRISAVTLQAAVDHRVEVQKVAPPSEVAASGGTAAPSSTPSAVAAFFTPQTKRMKRTIVPVCLTERKVDMGDGVHAGARTEGMGNPRPSSEGGEKGEEGKEKTTVDDGALCPVPAPAPGPEQSQRMEVEAV